MFYLLCQSIADLCALVGALLQLARMGCLLYEIEKALRELLVSKRIRSTLVIRHFGRERGIVVMGE